MGYAGLGVSLAASVALIATLIQLLRVIAGGDAGWQDIERTMQLSYVAQILAGLAALVAAGERPETRQGLALVLALLAIFLAICGLVWTRYDPSLAFYGLEVAIPVSLVLVIAQATIGPWSALYPGAVLLAAVLAGNSAWVYALWKAGP